MAKLETAKRTADDALALLAQAQAMEPPHQLLLQFERDMGGRDAVLAWLDTRMYALAVEWVRMDERRTLMAGMRDVVMPALAALNDIAQCTVESETRRHDGIRKAKRGGSKASSDDYIGLCAAILSEGLNGAQRNAAFRVRVAKEGWPEVPDRTRRDYFAKAKKR